MEEEILLSREEKIRFGNNLMELIILLNLRKDEIYNCCLVKAMNYFLNWHSFLYLHLVHGYLRENSYRYSIIHRNINIHGHIYRDISPRYPFKKPCIWTCTLIYE